MPDLRRGSSRTRSSAGDTSGDRARRRFTRRQWARRWGTVRLLLVGLLLTGLVAGGIWLVWFSRVLAVEGVDVHGTRLLSHSEVRGVAAVAEGEPLARIDLDAARARVEALAEVRSADVSRAWPDTVRVDVVERVAVAVVDLNGRLRGMDADGVVFQEFSKPPATLPRVQTAGTASSEALREAAAVVDSLPDEIARRTEYVEVETVDQIGLALRDGRQVVWGSAEDSELKARALTAVLGQQARVYDVSVPERPVTRSTP